MKRREFLDRLDEMENPTTQAEPQDRTECDICMVEYVSMPDNPPVSICSARHVFCRDCVIANVNTHQENRNRCPTCREVLWYVRLGDFRDEYFEVIAWLCDFDVIPTRIWNGDIFLFTEKEVMLLFENDPDSLWEPREQDTLVRRAYRLVEKSLHYTAAAARAVLVVAWEALLRETRPGLEPPEYIRPQLDMLQWPSRDREDALYPGDAIEALQTEEDDEFALFRDIETLVEDFVRLTQDRLCHYPRWRINLELFVRKELLSWRIVDELPQVQQWTIEEVDQTVSVLAKALARDIAEASGNRYKSLKRRRLNGDQDVSDARLRETDEADEQEQARARDACEEMGRAIAFEMEELQPLRIPEDIFAALNLA